MKNPIAKCEALFSDAEISLTVLVHLTKVEMNLRNYELPVAAVL